MSAATSTDTVPVGFTFAALFPGRAFINFRELMSVLTINEDTAARMIESGDLAAETIHPSYSRPNRWRIGAEAFDDWATRNGSRAFFLK